MQAKSYTLRFDLDLSANVSALYFLSHKFLKSMKSCDFKFLINSQNLQLFYFISDSLEKAASQQAWSSTKLHSEALTLTVLHQLLRLVGCNS